MKTIIAGMRDFYDYAFVEPYLDMLRHEITEVVSGCATGIDSLGERWAKANGIPIRRFPADWSKHGKAAGPIRNRQMADYADALIAFWDRKSKGTKNMIETAKKSKMKVHIFHTGLD